MPLLDHNRTSRRWLLRFLLMACRKLRGLQLITLLRNEEELRSRKVGRLVTCSLFEPLALCSGDFCLPSFILWPLPCAVWGVLLAYCLIRHCSTRTFAFRHIYRLAPHTQVTTNIRNLLSFCRLSIHLNLCKHWVGRHMSNNAITYVT